MSQVAEPYTPPAAELEHRGALTPVVIAWSMAGACLGTFLGALLQLLGLSPSLAPWGLGVAGLGALAALAAIAADRSFAEARTPVSDGRGGLVRPVGAWLVGAPVLIGLPGVLGLVVVGTIRTGSPVVGAGFLILAGAATFTLRPTIARHWLSGAVQQAERGEVLVARRTLIRLAEAWWVPPSVGSQAAVNLALLALRDGRLADAARWYEVPKGGQSAALAAVGLGLVRALQGRHDEVEPALRRAARLGGGPAIQGQIDGVRLLVVWRTEGADEALTLARRLEGPSSGVLFRALAVALSSADGGEVSAQARRERQAVFNALEEAGLRRHLPELDPVSHE